MDSYYLGTKRVKTEDTEQMSSAGRELTFEEKLKEIEDRIKHEDDDEQD